MCDRSFCMLALGLWAITLTAAPVTAHADADAPSAAFDRELVIEDGPPGRFGVLSSPPAAPRNHVLNVELATDYVAVDEELAGTLRAIYTYKPWAQLRISAAGTQRSFGGEDLTQGVFSAGVGFKHGKHFSWRVTGLLKVTEGVDSATMATAVATTPGIDGQGRLELAGGKLVTSGRVGVRFSDPAAVIGVLSEAVQLGETFGVGAQLAATVTGGDPALEAGLNVAARLKAFELGLAVSTPVDDLAMMVSVYMTYTFSAPARR
jgi:hypothetical protein